jgi:integrase
MPMLVRPRRGGKAFELRVKHSRLPKPVYRTFDREADARRAGELALVALDRGEVPPWLQRSDVQPFGTVAAVIRAYRGALAVPASTRDLLDTIVQDIGAHPLAEVDYAWAEAWIKAMKVERQLVPGTIRKRKGALARVLDWLVNAHPLQLSTNPLNRLPRGYSGYDENTCGVLTEQGLDTPEDIERNRRIDPQEEQRIVAFMEERIAQAQTPEEKAEAEGAILMFQLALRTAMRLRELYSLTIDQVSLERKSIFLEQTKNGDRRQVPLNREARALLAREWPALKAARKGDRLFPFWDGSLAGEALKATTSRVSHMYALIFKKAGSTGLHFHDTRHEAICRWVLASPTLTSEQLGRAAGMRDARTRARYLSLRGSEIADVLDNVSAVPASLDASIGMHDARANGHELSVGVPDSAAGLDGEVR